MKKCAFDKITNPRLIHNIIINNASIELLIKMTRKFNNKKMKNNLCKNIEVNLT